MDLPTELPLADGQCLAARGDEPDLDISRKDEFVNSTSDQLEEPKKDNEPCVELEEKKQVRNRKRKIQLRFQTSDEVPQETELENVLPDSDTGSFEVPAVKENCTDDGNGSQCSEVVADYTRHDVVVELEAELKTQDGTLPALVNPVYEESDDMTSDEREPGQLGRFNSNGFRTVLPCIPPQRKKMGLALRTRDSLEWLGPIDFGIQRHGSSEKQEEEGRQCLNSFKNPEPVDRK